MLVVPIEARNSWRASKGVHHRGHRVSQGLHGCGIWAEKLSILAENETSEWLFNFGNREFLVDIPPPPRISGIIGLGGNCKVIYGAQSVTGKILEAKGLRILLWHLSLLLRHDDDRPFCFCPQGQMSHWAVDIVRRLPKIRPLALKGVDAGTSDAALKGRSSTVVPALVFLSSIHIDGQ